MKVDYAKVDKVFEVVDELAKTDHAYTFDAFLTKNNLYSDLDRKRLGDIFICCPFHKDKTPSLSIDEEGRRFRCFGCEAKRSYSDFIVKYENEVLGLPTTKAQKANEFLKNDPRIQMAAGFSTVYQSESKNISEFKKIQFGSFKIRKTGVQSYTELASWMLKQKLTEEQLVFGVSLAQKEMEPAFIQKQLLKIDDYVCDSDNKVSNKKYTLSSLEEE